MERIRAKSQAPKIQSILDLPEHIVMEIMARLPPKTLLICRYVCKSWRIMISDPDFAKLLQFPTLILRTGFDDIRYLIFSVERYLIGGDSKADIHLPDNAISEFTTKFHKPCYELEVLSCCNGLICFHTPRIYMPYYVYDPVLEEYFVVPQIDSEVLDHAGSGFGFSPKTNEYKVIRFLVPKFVNVFRFQLEVEIMTVGTNLWRKIGVAPSYLHWISSGCFLVGGLHWIVHDSDNRFDSLCVFDIAEEKFKQFPSPSQFVNEIVNDMKMGVFGSCISIIRFATKHQIDIWVMKEYGIKESWIKEFVVETPCESRLYQPIMLLNNGELLLLLALTSIVSYSASDCRFRYIRFTGRARYSKAIAYTPGFVSIKEAVRGKTVKMCRP